LCDQDLAPYEKFAAMIERNWDGVVAYSQPTVTGANFRATGGVTVLKV